MSRHVSASLAGTAPAPSRQARRLALGAALCVICVLGSACGLPYDSSPQALPGVLPQALTSPGAKVPTTTLPRHGALADLYYVQNDRLSEFPQHVLRPLTVAEVLSTLEGGPSISDAVAGSSVTNACPACTDLQALGVVKGVARIGLDEAFYELESPQADLELGQIVYTLIGTTLISPEGEKALGITAVQFYFNGSPVDAENGNGQYVTGAVTEADYCSVTTTSCPISKKTPTPK